MKRIRLLALVLAVITVIAVTVSIHAQAQAARRGWQYAYFTENNVGGQDFFSFVSKSKSASGQSLVQFVQAYTGHPVPKADYADALTAIGADGWELIGLRDETRPLTMTWFYFKRPAN